ncbi:MAG TPA: GNAT family N-acetyltransferase [Candidatus Lokiarchaeia archaeon]|nr:GNAT family N-acetyltransferase [Candidatus Lokiarchaeia archaeon]
MIRECTVADFDAIYDIINDAAIAYKNHIPADCWHEPYMSREHLQEEIDAGITFHCYEEDGELIGVMGIQDVKDVTLFRHAYVRTARRNQGIGGQLLSHLAALAAKPVMIGTWKAATWAIGFYEEHGFTLVDERTKNKLLKKYWTIPARQIETSVVLVQQGSKYLEKSD